MWVDPANIAFCYMSTLRRALQLIDWSIWGVSAALDGIATARCRLNFVDSNSIEADDHLNADPEQYHEGRLP